MSQRFFKLLYVFAFVAIGLSLPIYLLTSIRFDRVVITSYQVKCLLNDRYVVLQGAQPNDFDVITETFWNSENHNSLSEMYNFYCKYYDEIQPHIVAYAESNTPAEEVRANRNYRSFEESVGK